MERYTSHQTLIKRYFSHQTFRWNSTFPIRHWWKGTFPIRRPDETVHFSSDVQMIQYISHQTSRWKGTFPIRCPDGNILFWSSIQKEKLNFVDPPGCHEVTELAHQHLHTRKHSTEKCDWGTSEPWTGVISTYIHEEEEGETEMKLAKFREDHLNEFVLIT